MSKRRYFNWNVRDVARLFISLRAVLPLGTYFLFLSFHRKIGLFWCIQVLCQKQTYLPRNQGFCWNCCLVRCDWKYQHKSLLYQHTQSVNLLRYMWVRACIHIHICIYVCYIHLHMYECIYTDNTYIYCLLPKLLRLPMQLLRMVSVGLRRLCCRTQARGTLFSEATWSQATWCQRRLSWHTWRISCWCVKVMMQECACTCMHV